jgi:hypothetical protein
LARKPKPKIGEIPCGLDHDHHPGLQLVVGCRGKDHLQRCLPRRARQSSQQLPVMEEIGTDARAEGPAGRHARGRAAASVGWGRSIFGTVITHWACPTDWSTPSVSSAAVAAERFAAHDGHKSRVLQENASRYTSAQSGQRTRANLCS